MTYVEFYNIYWCQYFCFQAIWIFIYLFVAIIAACLNVFELLLNIDNRRKSHWCDNNFQLYIFISATTHLIGFNQFKWFRRILTFKGAFTWFFMKQTTHFSALRAINVYFTCDQNKTNAFFTVLNKHLIVFSYESKLRTQLVSSRLFIIFLRLNDFSVKA